MNNVANVIIKSLGHPLFEFVILPILIILCAVVLKCLVRGGSATKFDFKREDLLFGFDLGVTALLTLVLSSVKAAERHQALQAEIQRSADEPTMKELVAKQAEAFSYLAVAPTFLFLAVVGLLALAFVAGMKAWDTSKDPIELRSGWIVTCDLAGLFFLVGALALGGLLR
jgi:hypothetical protein